MSDTDPQAPSLPYRYTLPASPSRYLEVDVAGGGRLWLLLPSGDDAIPLARAVLAAAGDTGHIVVSTDDSAMAIRIREAVAAESMRERADELAREADRYHTVPATP